MATEFELKFDISPSLVQELQASTWFQGRESSTKREELVSVYFDTPRLKLYDRQVSLRIRHIGAKRLQGIKLGCGGSVRQEWETEVDSDVPDFTVVDGTALEPLATRKLARKLKPIFETRVERTLSPLEVEGSQIELALDQGLIKAGERSETICELELELKNGDPRAVVETAKRLAAQFPLRYALESKAERGYGLYELNGESAVRADPIELDPNANVGDAAQSIALSCLRHFALNAPGVSNGDAEAVHQMRVGVRRLRAALSIFKKLFSDGELENIKSELRWLTEQLSPARDYDVLVKETVEPLMEEGGHQPELATLETVVNDKRAEGFQTAKAAVNDDRYRRVVLSTALWLHGGDWMLSFDGPRIARREARLKPFARRELRDRVRKIRKRLEKLESMDARKRHELRIAVKKLHYGTQFFESLFPRAKSKLRAQLKVLKKLQDALGELNDMTVHSDLAAGIVDAVPPPDGSQAAFAIGVVMGKEECDVRPLLRAARRAGKRLVRRF
ncbi:MAG TPA: CHAD domain-containing protein [Polyangiaceae bacterium]|nr:CHAD domain-containing protein [Polyangiaceae bacterium]